MITKPSGPVVGFDLDLTLVDSAAAIVATLQAALAEVGVEITPEQVWPTIGVGLQEALLDLAPDVDAQAVVSSYRQLYPRYGVPITTLLPGAAEAFRAVRRHGGRVLVVSAKIESAVRASLHHVGLDVAELAPEEIVGGLFGAAKGVRLAEAGADVYVGDHPGDVEAARVAGAVSVGVATGPHSADALLAHGADIVLPDLTAFTPWLDEFVDQLAIVRTKGVSSA